MSVSHCTSQQMAPLTDATLLAVAQLFDDGGVREPSHSDIEFQINQCGLAYGDLRAQGQPVGKAKRIRGTLSWAMENDPEGGEALVVSLISLLRAQGGFRSTSPNYVGDEAIRNATDAFGAEGYALAGDGELQPSLLDNLSGADLTEALQRYVRRARRGVRDAALVTGTGKDLLEATAAHILVERYGSYPTSSNFPTLLGQAFVALGLATPQDPQQAGEAPQRRLERAMYEAACAVNHLRNKEGTGHGRPWVPSVTDTEAGVAVGVMGSIAEWLLQVHRER